MVTTAYWASTLIVSGFLLLSSYTYFFSKSTIQGLRELGFPDFFRIQLGILQGIAAVILLLPKVPAYLREWAYAGVGLFLLTAAVAHVAHRDSWGLLALLVLLFVLLAVSRYALGNFAD